MHLPVSRQQARESLRQLTVPHALDFGARLLRRGKSPLLTFREFVAVARECWEEAPDAAATYLAALVALEMASDEGAPACPVAPSRN